MYIFYILEQRFVTFGMDDLSQLMSGMENRLKNQFALEMKKHSTDVKNAMQTELQGVKDEVLSLRKDVQDYKERAETFEKKYDDLKKQQGDLRQRINELRDLNSRLNVENHEHKRKELDTNNKIAQLEEKNNTLHTELELVQEELSSLKTEIEEKKETIKNLESENTNLNAEKEDLIKRLNDQESELEIKLHFDCQVTFESMQKEINELKKQTEEIDARTRKPPPTNMTPRNRFQVVRKK